MTQQLDQLASPKPAGRSRVRPFAPEDVQAVANVYEQVIRSGQPVAPPGLADDFHRIFFESPSRDAELPSLVYEDAGGNVAGFLGVYVRRLVFDGQPIRMACSGQLVTLPEVRNQLAGVLLLQRFLQGPQQLSITDGATDEVQRIWERLGGQTAWMHCLRWTRPLRPAQFTGEYLARRKAWRPIFAAGRPLLALADRTLRRAFVPLAPSVGSCESQLEPADILAGLSSVAAGRRLRPDYDEPYLTWLLDEMARVDSRGPLVARLVRDAAGRTLGWYAFYMTPEGIAEAVQVAATGDDLGVVFDHLFAEANRRGALAVQGRLEAGFLPSLDRRRCWLQYRAPFALIHSRDDRLLGAIQAGQSFLTRADGEWWTGFHL